MRGELKTAIVLGVAIAGGHRGMSAYLSGFESEPVVPAAPGEPIDKSGFRTAPDIVGIAEYITPRLRTCPRTLRGMVVLYDIWTYSCINCLRTLPFITAWDEKYSDQDCSS